MSKGLGKLQLAILREMSFNEDSDQGFFTHQVIYLVERTGSSQQSVNRAMRGLLSAGLVVREHRKSCPIGGGIAKREFQYILPELIKDEVDWFHNKAMAINSDMTKLGISYEEWEKADADRRFKAAFV